MNKRERVDAVLEGREVDRLPVSFWYHFGVQHVDGEKFADIVLDFYRYYDLDWLKVMNDYYYPMPEGVYELRTKKDLAKLDRFNVEKSALGEQLKALDKIADGLDGQAYFMDTAFDPWQVLQRSLVGGKLLDLAHSEPEAVKEALDIVAENTIEYCRESFKRGSAGILISTLGSADQMSRDDFLTFAKPYLVKIFRAIEGQGMLNTAHIHDTSIYTDDITDIPAPVLNYEDRHPSNPSIGEIREKWNGVVMGGIDKTEVTRRSPQEVAENVKEGIRQAAGEPVLLSPGCSVPTWLYPGSGRVMVETAKQYGKPN